MTETTLRLARLRQLANTATTPDYGREQIARLLDQRAEARMSAAPDMPASRRTAAIARSSSPTTLRRLSRSSVSSRSRRAPINPRRSSTSIPRYATRLTAR